MSETHSPEAEKALYPNPPKRRSIPSRPPATDEPAASGAADNSAALLVEALVSIEASRAATVSELNGESAEHPWPFHTAVEIGCHRGRLSRMLLDAFPAMGLLVMVDSWAVYAPDHPQRAAGDPFACLTAHQQWRNQVAAQQATDCHKLRRSILRLPSAKAVRRFNVPRTSFVVVDGSPLYVDRLADMEAWWPRIEPGGVLIGLDFDSKLSPATVDAVGEFGDRLGRPPDSNRGIWWFVKDGHPSDGREAVRRPPR